MTQSPKDLFWLHKLSINRMSRLNLLQGLDRTGVSGGVLLQMVRPDSVGRPCHSPTCTFDVTWRNSGHQMTQQALVWRLVPECRGDLEPPYNIPYSCPPPLIPAPPRWVTTTPMVVSATHGMFTGQLRHRRDPTPRTPKWPEGLQIGEPRTILNL